jgi:hypothetical protein
MELRLSTTSLHHLLGHATLVTLSEMITISVRDCHPATLHSAVQFHAPEACYQRDNADVITMATSGKVTPVKRSDTSFFISDSSSHMHKCLKEA